jgi:hypothetical protein
MVEISILCGQGINRIVRMSLEKGQSPRRLGQVLCSARTTRQVARTLR